MKIAPGILIRINLLILIFISAISLFFACLSIYDAVSSGAFDGVYKRTFQYNGQTFKWDDLDSFEQQSKRTDMLKALLACFAAPAIYCLLSATTAWIFAGKFQLRLKS